MSGLVRGMAMVVYLEEGLMNGIDVLFGEINRGFELKDPTIKDELQMTVSTLCLSKPREYGISLQGFYHESASHDGGGHGCGYIFNYGSLRSGCGKGFNGRREGHMYAGERFFNTELSRKDRG
jgi:hypothetical protein